MVEKIIFKYFDVKVLFEPKIKVSFSLKKEYKQKEPLFKSPGKSYSGSCVEYYTHYLGKELGEKVYTERRKYFGLKNSIMFAVEHLSISIDEKEKLLTHLKEIKDKAYVNYKKVTSSISYIENHKKGLEKSKGIRSKKAKERWQNEEWKSEMMKKMFSQEALKKRTIAHKTWVNENKELIKVRTLKRNTECPWVLNNLRQNSKRRFMLNNINMNSIEYIVGSLLTEMGIVWEYEKKFTCNKETFIPDFYLPDYKIIIECFGDYWHCHEDYIKEDYIVNGKIKVSDVRLKDEQRKNFFINLGYKFIVFWEHEIVKKMNSDNLKNKILETIENGKTN